MPSIRQNVLDYLLGYLPTEITVAHGYNFDVATVSRGLRYPDELPDSAFPAIFISATDEQRQNISKIHFRAKINVAFICFVKNPTGVGGVQTSLDKFIADLGKAIEKDRTQNSTVLWTGIDRIRTDDGDLGSHGAAVIDVGFNYATAGVTP